METRARGDISLPPYETLCMYPTSLQRMQLAKLTDEEKLKISRKYFIIGCFLLPMVWLMNAVWFFREAFFKRSNPTLRLYVGGSLVGFLVWLVVFIVWVAVYQTQRPHWDAFGDYISFTVPLGKP